MNIKNEDRRGDEQNIDERVVHDVEIAQALGYSKVRQAQRIAIGNRNTIFLFLFTDDVLAAETPTALANVLYRCGCW